VTTASRPSVSALLGERADRALCGSDRPHTGGTPAGRGPDRVQPCCLTVDDARSLPRFTQQLSTSRLRQVLVDNPAALYGL
jgi:hypothetical protein